jgi:hypothetical protein
MMIGIILLEENFVLFYSSCFLLQYYHTNDKICLHEQETLRVDGDILFGLLKKVAPGVYKHLVSTSLHIVPLIVNLFVFQCHKTP